MQNWSYMVQRKYQKSFKALSSYPRMQDDHKISPLAPFQFLVHRQYHAFSLELFWWQICFNLQFCWTNFLLSLFAVIPSFLPALPPELNAGFPPLDTLPYKHTLLQINQWSILWGLSFSKFLSFLNCPWATSLLLYFFFKSHSSPLPPGLALKLHFCHLWCFTKSSFHHMITEEHLLWDVCIQLQYLMSTPLFRSPQLLFQ